MKPGDNPFASHIISTIEYQFGAPDELDKLLLRFEQNNRRGAVIGPHGTGKTTLLRRLRKELEGRGAKVSAYELKQDQKLLPIIPQRDVLLIIDGAEQIPLWRWWLVLLGAERIRTGGILITAHKPGLLPTIFETRFSPDLLGELVHRLAGEQPSSDLLTELQQKHGDNTREALREMYDRYSRGQR